MNQASIKEPAMRFELRLKGIRMTDQLRSFIEKRLRSMMRRFSHRVRRVRVLLVDINGPRGDADIECHIHASLGRAGEVTIKETRCDPYSAVARASQRTAQQLSRRLSRAHMDRRGR